jgi:serine/threonine protein kinase
MVECAHCHAELPEDGAVCPHCGQPTQAEADDLIGSSVLGRYNIVRLLAEGGMGRVYLAEQAVGTVVRRVAIKVLRKQLGLDRQLVARFSREAETLVRLTHPNTVQLFDFGALPDGTLALVMEYVEGHSLARELSRGALSVPRAERVLSQVCGALSEAHAHGIVHRDLKPENLLIAERVGHGDFIKVLDFGIAKVSSEDPASHAKLTQQGMIIGTPPYMSPEQFSGEPIDARSDIYSLGVIAFELLTGKLPFDAKTPWEWASRHLTTKPEELPIDGANGLGKSHALAIRSALAKKADDRPQTVAEFLDVFTGRATPASSVPTLREAVPADTKQTASRPAASTHTGATTDALARKKRTVWATAGIAVALLIGGVALGRSGRNTDAARPVAVVASLPSIPTPLPSALPAGAALPSAPEEESAHNHEPGRGPRATAERSHTHRREHEGSTERSGSAAPAVPPQAATPPDLATPAARVSPAHPAATNVAVVHSHAEQPGAATSASSTLGRRAATSPESPAQRGGAISPDLKQRIDQIRAASSGRVETAIGLYQAAAGRFGPSSALQEVRSELARAGEKRVFELLRAGRCAQAQALFRALRATGATVQASSSFGPACPKP